MKYVQECSNKRMYKKCSNKIIFPSGSCMWLYFNFFLIFTIFSLLTHTHILVNFLKLKTRIICYSIQDKIWSLFLSNIKSLVFKMNNIFFLKHSYIWRTRWKKLEGSKGKEMIFDWNLGQLFQDCIRSLELWNKKNI